MQTKTQKIIGNFITAFATSFLATAVVTGDEITGLYAGLLVGIMQGLISCGKYMSGDTVITVKSSTRQKVLNNLTIF